MAFVTPQVAPISSDELDLQVVVDGTDIAVGNSKVIQLPDGFERCRLLRWISEVKSGDATVHTPQVTRTSDDEVLAEGPGDTLLHDRAFVGGIALYIPGGELKYLSGVDAGTNNVVRLELLLRKGWVD